MPVPAPIVEAWIDYSSPFAYLGSTQIERVAREAGAAGVRFRPFLLGGLFRTIGTPLVPIAAMPEAKRRLHLLDLERWADVWGVPFRFASRFPLRTVDALRLTLLAPEERRAPLVHALMRATWAEDRDPADRAVLAAACAEAGIDAALALRTGEAKAALVAETEEAVRLGLCGAPTFVVDGQLFWGQDRLEHVALGVRGWRVEPRHANLPQGDPT
jgi:2-hydroxychromene-2-carboxylate isomerase